MDAGEVYELCISRIRNEDLKKRALAAKPHVVKAAADYKALAAQVLLHQFVGTKTVGAMSTAEMEGVYTQRMVGKTSPGRDMYDKLMATAPHGKCPLCAQRDASTLDHHLPKAHYPSLAVSPLNLVPSCKDCNKAKLDLIPGSSNEEMLHPYFDDVEADRWLHAEVLPSAPAALHFQVVPPNHWSIVLSDRVSLHFDTLGLDSLYAAQGADELLNIRHQLRMIHDHGGAVTVREELLARANSARKVANAGRVWALATRGVGQEPDRGAAR